MNQAHKNIPPNPSKTKVSKLFMKNTQYKKQVRESFEKQFLDNPQFDAYIDSQYKKMIQQKNQNPMLNIPRGFLKFVQSKTFKELLKRTYIYMESLSQFQNKYQSLLKQQQVNSNQIDDPLFKMLRLQTDALQEKCKQIGFAYMGILLGYGDNKLVFKDQYFFETMIYFLTKILNENFQSNSFYKVEEQLNRIFRTNTFNLIKRRHQEDEMYKKFPALKQSKYDGSQTSQAKLEARLSLQRKNNYSMQLRSVRNKSIQKPINIPLSTFHSIRSRSPLIASFYPSAKQKLFHFSKQVREKQSFIKTSRDDEMTKNINLFDKTTDNFMIRKRKSRYSDSTNLKSSNYSHQLGFMNNKTYL